MSASDPSSWIERAERDLIAAQDLYGAKEPLTDIIVYHLQQSAEKFLKAFIVSNGARAERTHDLYALMLRCQSFDKTLPDISRSLIALTKLAGDARYPDTDVLPTVEQVEESLRTAQSIKSEILRRIPRP